MKTMTYECKKCGKPCNGEGISYAVIQTEGKAVLVMSRDMDELTDHACREEHALQIFGDVLREIKGTAAPAEVEG